MLKYFQVLLIFITAWIGILVPTIVGVGDTCFEYESKDCIIPKEPNNVTKYHKVNEGSEISLGSLFLNINITCSPGYELRGPASYDCYNGCWNSPFNSTCVQIQRSGPDCYLPKNSSVEYKCINQKSEHIEECNEYVAQGIIVKLHCLEPKSKTLPHMNCKNGQWDYIATCKSEIQQLGPNCYLPKHPTVTYYCFNQTSVYIGECDEYVPQGIVVKPRCVEPTFRAPKTLLHMNCINGKWDYIATCEPECGTVIPKGKPLVINGSVAFVGEIPWHAGIYYKQKNEYELICGGSLISRSIVISAAHCFYNNDTQEKAKYFSVAMGKQYRDWGDVRDINPQKSPVKDIHLSPFYGGAWKQNQADIAILELVNKIKYEMHVRPICISFDDTFAYNIQNGTMEKVAGWGYSSERGDLPSQLQVIDIPYIDINTCKKNIPRAYEKYLLTDKFCAGYTNKNSSVCEGDSGGGLAFPLKEPSITRYYLHGIVSTQPTINISKKCEPEFYITFTNVLQYKDFILKYLTVDYPNTGNGNIPNIESRFSTSNDIEVASAISKYLKPWISISGNCILPDHPENGHYHPIFPNAAPGDTFDFVSIHVICDQGFRVISADRSGNAYCYNGTWFPEKLPECEKQCHLPQHRSVEYRCLVMGTNNYYRECKEYEPSGAIAMPICRSPVYTSKSVLNRMRCVSGEWNYVAVCKPTCGVLSKVYGRNSDTKDVSESHSRIPWGAFLYTKTETPYKLICGGTLISNNLVITAAHCVQDSKRMKIPEFNFGIAVGLSNINWGTRHEWEQLSEVKSTHIVNDGKPAVDIAMIVAATPFKYYAQVQPLCVDFQRRQYNHYDVGRVNGIPLRRTFDNEFVRDIKMHPINLNNCIYSHSDVPMPKNMICAMFNNDGKTHVLNGSGLAFPGINDSYYLEGVFSKLVSSNVVLYTKLYNLKNSLKNLIQKYEIND